MLSSHALFPFRRSRPSNSQPVTSPTHLSIVGWHTITASTLPAPAPSPVRRPLWSFNIVVAPRPDRFLPVPGRPSSPLPAFAHSTRSARLVNGVGSSLPSFHWFCRFLACHGRECPGSCSRNDRAEVREAHALSALARCSVLLPCRLLQLINEVSPSAQSHTL